MNKLPIPIILFASAITLLSSCSKQSSVSLTKRHYRSGYYVDFSTKPHTYKTSKVATLPKKETYQTLPVEITKSERLLVVDPSLSTPEKFIVGTNVKAKKNIVHKNEIVNHVSSEQNPFIQNASIPNSLSESSSSSITAREDEVRVYVVNVPFVIILLCAIFIPPLGVGLMYGLNIYFWVDLLLTLLFFIPGLIFALVVVLM